MKLFGHYCIVISKCPAGKKMTSNIHPAFRQDILFAVKALIISQWRAFFSSARRLPTEDDSPLWTCLVPHAVHLLWNRPEGQAGRLSGRDRHPPALRSLPVILVLKHVASKLGNCRSYWPSQKSPDGHRIRVPTWMFFLHARFLNQAF